MKGLAETKKGAKAVPGRGREGVSEDLPEGSNGLGLAGSLGV